MNSDNIYDIQTAKGLKYLDLMITVVNNLLSICDKSALCQVSVVVKALKRTEKIILFEEIRADYAKCCFL